MHAGGLVHVVEVRLRPGAHGTEGGRLAGERDGSAEGNGGGRDARVLRWASTCAADDDERTERHGYETPGHLVTGFRRPGIASTAFPTRTRALGAIGRSR